jgi:lipopolysaccharide/colanic/teichoic acid biosynthesis glycosyltransferase
MTSKRLLDLVLVLAAAPLLLLAGGALALVVLAVDGRPVLFSQPRVGRGGRPFQILKLRSMTTEADPAARRPTRLGAWLRARGLDELPQAWNVLRGDMSLVGPRPLTLADAVRLVRRHAQFAARLEATPGITGLAQVNGCRGETQTLEEMRSIASKLQELGPNWAPTFVAHALVKWSEWDYPAAKQFAHRATVLAPDYGFGHLTYGFLLTQWGLTDEGRKELETARRLVPCCSFMVIAQAARPSCITPCLEIWSRFCVSTAATSGYSTCAAVPASTRPRKTGPSKPWRRRTSLLP